MNRSARSELDVLRYRAYGPSADIGDDPGALNAALQFVKDGELIGVFVSSPSSD